MIPVFTKRAKRATIQHPKLYFYDTGLYHALRPSGQLDKPDCRLYFCRTSAGSEAKKALVYRGRERLLIDEVLVEPCEDFLLSLN